METPVCRTCLAATEGSIFKTIDIDQGPLSLVEMLSECTGLKVTKSDEISLNICDNCTDEIINSYFYRRKCWDSHNFLLRRLEEKKTIDLIKYEMKIELEDFPLTSNMKDDECNTYASRSLITPMSNINDLDEVEFTPNCETVSDSEIISDPLLFESEQDKASVEPILLKSEMSNIGYVKCEGCEKTYSSRNLLLTHLREFHDLCEEEMKVCELEVCSENVHEVNNSLSDKELELFNSVANILDPPNIGRVTCEVCDKIFARKSLWVRHMRDVHKITRTSYGEYQCKYCRKLDSISNLNRHIRLDHVQSRTSPKYICDICGLVVRDNRNFTTHMRRHTGEKPYKCDYCDYRASHPTSVTTHMRTHTGDRPYKCAVCYKDFTTAGVFADHRRIHSDDTPFECTVCFRKFKRRAAWREHKVIHDPDRLIKCNICGRNVIKTNLKRHMSQHET